MKKLVPFCCLVVLAGVAAGVLTYTPPPPARPAVPADRPRAATRPCPACGGTGLTDDPPCQPPDACPRCGGTGKVAAAE